PASQHWSIASVAAREACERHITSRSPNAHGSDAYDHHLAATAQRCSHAQTQKGKALLTALCPFISTKSTTETHFIRSAVRFSWLCLSSFRSCLAAFDCRLCRCGLSITRCFNQ